MIGNKAGISWRRAYLIARRDYIGYVKTWGFWLSFIFPFFMGGLFFLVTLAGLSVEPTRYETILDETGQYGQAIQERHTKRYEQQKYTALKQFSEYMLSNAEQKALDKAYRKEGFDGALAHLDKKLPGVSENVRLPELKTEFIDPPADSLEGLQPYLKGEKMVIVNGEPEPLSGLLYISGEGKDLSAQYWSTRINDNTVKSLASGYFRDRSTRNYLATGGLTPEGLSQARRAYVDIESYNPKKEAGTDGGGQEVTMTDRIPFLVSALMAGMLWLTIFSGAYMLLTSMLEEKLNKLMEMMLASVKFSEIMVGKLVGVAALTITAMLPYILIGIGGIIATFMFGDTEAAAGLRAAFSPKMLVFAPIFLMLGYIFYGSMFIALGALAESMQDAQTLTTPIMLVLTLCMMVVPLGLSSPDSPIVTFASWFPLSAPFAAIVRLPLDPPWWELALSAGFMALLCVGLMILSARVFRYGILSGGGVKSVKDWFTRVIFRRKTRA